MAQDPIDSRGDGGAATAGGFARGDQDSARLGDSPLRSQLAFEQLLSNLGTAFVNLPAEQIDAHITMALRTIVEFLDIDRANIFQSSGDVTDMTNWRPTHSWAAADLPTLHGGNRFPWMLSRVLRDETVVFNRVEELPAEAAEDAAAFRIIGTRSHVTVPLSR